MTFTGTRYDSPDFYSYLIDEQEIPLMKLEALSPNNKRRIKCPNYSEADLIHEKKIDLWTFEASMNNNPLPSEGQYFRKENWVQIEDIPLRMVWNKCYITYDPSFGKSTSADFSALTVGHIWDDKINIRLTELHKGLSLDQQIWLLRYYKKWLSPIRMYTELTFGQVWLQQQAGDSLYLEPWDKPGEPKLKKTQRIDGLSVPYAAKLLTHSKNMASGAIIPNHSCHQNRCGTPNIEANKQYIQYDRKDSTSAKKDDYLDAEYTMYDKLKHYLNTEGWYSKTW